MGVRGLERDKDKEILKVKCLEREFVGWGFKERKIMGVESLEGEREIEIGV